MKDNCTCVFPDTSSTAVPVLNYTAAGVLKSLEGSKQRLGIEFTGSALYSIKDACNSFIGDKNINYS
jgi:hypothetical protein